jgi:hypothetical protein
MLMGAGIGRLSLVAWRGGGVRWVLGLAVGCSVAGALAATGASAAARSLSGATPADGAQPTAVAVQLAAPARAVHGSDGHELIEYDLVITNAFTAPVTLKSVLVHGDGKAVVVARGRRIEGPHVWSMWTPPAGVTQLHQAQDHPQRRRLASTIGAEKTP